MPAILKKVFKIFLFIILSILLLEAALRVSGNLYLTKLYLNLYKATNSHPDDINIVCLGESSTAGLWLDPRDSYPKQLERKLQEYYANWHIRTIIPPHLGQNTSQTTNRIKKYVTLYRPKLIILMMGSNNEWSLAESHVQKFLTGIDAATLKIKILIALEGWRLFKVARYLYLKFVAKKNPDYLTQNPYYIYGHPELTRYPPEHWIYSFAETRPQAFIALWRYDMWEIIKVAKELNIKVLMMTYHINPTYLPVKEFISLSKEQEIPLVRNDESFEILIKEGTINKYLLSDDWHPNKEGYSLIASNAFESIKKYNLLGLN